MYGLRPHENIPGLWQPLLVRDCHGRAFFLVTEGYLREKKKHTNKKTHKGLLACGPQALPGRPGFATEGSSGRLPHNSLCVRARLVKRLETAAHTNFSRPGNFTEQILVCPQTVMKTRRRDTNFSSDFSRRAFGFQVHGRNGDHATTIFPSPSLRLCFFAPDTWPASSTPPLQDKHGHLQSLCAPHGPARPSGD